MAKQQGNFPAIYTRVSKDVYDAINAISEESNAPMSSVVATILEKVLIESKTVSALESALLRRGIG